MDQENSVQKVIFEVYSDRTLQNQISEQQIELVNQSLTEILHSPAFGQVHKRFSGLILHLLFSNKFRQFCLQILSLSRKLDFLKYFLEILNRIAKTCNQDDVKFQYQIIENVRNPFFLNELDIFELTLVEVNFSTFNVRLNHLVCHFKDLSPIA